MGQPMMQPQQMMQPIMPHPKMGQPMMNQPMMVQQYGGMNMTGGPIRQNMNGNSRQNPYNLNNGSIPQQQPIPMQQPVIQQPMQPISGCPFNHIIKITGVTASATKDDIQKFFVPHKPVAVNNHRNGMCEVAFPDHHTAVGAMEKNNMILCGVCVNFELQSMQPVSVPTG